jgi:PAS domain S-box-containing protein
VSGDRPLDLFAHEPGLPLPVQGGELQADATRDRCRQEIARISPDSMTQFVGLLDLEGGVLEINQAALDAAGIELAEIEKKPFWTSFFWRDSDEVQTTLRDAIRRAARGEFVRWNTEIYGRAGSKERVMIEASMCPVKNERGNVVFITAEGRDIAQRKPNGREIAANPERTDAPKSQPNEPDRHGDVLERYQLQDLLAQAPAGIGVMSGPEHRWTYVNDCYVQMAGRASAADFIGKTLAESLPEVQSQGFIALLDKVYREDQPYVGREVKAYLNREARGLPNEAYFDFIYQPMRNKKGEVEGIFVHAVDVTERVSFRVSIEETAERLRLAQTAAQVGTWEWDPENDTQRLSPELHRIFGTDSSDPDHAQVWASRVFAPDLPMVQEVMREGYRTGNMEFEYRFVHPKAGLRWFYCKGGRFQGETRMLGMLQDITSRKAAEEASQRLAAIVESSDDAIISKNLTGIVTSWNSCAERMFGYSADEMIGRSITTIIPLELRDDETRILATIARGERVEHFETVRLRKDGERIEVSLTVSPVKDEHGKIVGAAKIARDITQRRKAERALRTTEMLASVGRLAATVAHEINNPLEAVINLIYLAKHSAVREEVRDYLAMAEEELARVSHLTRQTLGFYRETKGATRFRVGALVHSLLSVFSSRSRNKGISILPDFRQDPELFGVPGEIRQVIANLVSNSIDAIEAGGAVRIRVSRARRWNSGEQPGVRLSVADTGIGIPSAARSKLFEPFFTTKKDIGTGLGLWVCKSIVENHGGVIEIRSSTVPGKSWTVISVFLPFRAEGSSKENGFGEAVNSNSPVVEGPRSPALFETHVS